MSNESKTPGEHFAHMREKVSNTRPEGLTITQRAIKFGIGSLTFDEKIQFYAQQGDSRNAWARLKNRR